MRCTTRSWLGAAASLLLAACGSEPAPEPLPEGEPLSGFSSGFYLMTASGIPVLRRGGSMGIGHLPDADHFMIQVWLYRFDQDEEAETRCARLSSEVTATLDGQRMVPVHDSQQHRSCTERVFQLLVPVSRFKEAGGNVRVVLSDSSHTVSAEFEGFYGPPRSGPPSNEESLYMPVVSCEGAEGCIGIKPRGL